MTKTAKRTIAIASIIIGIIIGLSAFWFGHWWNNYMNQFSEPAWWVTPLEVTGYFCGCCIPAITAILLVTVAAPAMMLE